MGEQAVLRQTDNTPHWIHFQTVSAGSAGPLLLEPENIPSNTAVLGTIEKSGAPLLARLPSPDVSHILVTGAVGSGKTALLRTIVLSLAMANPYQELALMLIDTENHTFGPFENLPHLSRPIIKNTEAAIGALLYLMCSMGCRSDSAPRIVAIIDELTSVGDGGLAREALVQLTQRGHKSGIHVIAATRQPKTVLETLPEANFPVRLVGRVANAEDARAATGWSGTGAEHLLGQGDFLAVTEKTVRHFQAAYVSPAKIEEAIAYLTTRSSSWQRR